MKKLFAIVLACALVLALTGCNSVNFVSAVEKYEAGNYAEAADLFRKLGDYKDSALRLQECEYQLAVAAMADKRYEEAAQILGSLGDYRDAADKAAIAATAASLKSAIGRWSGSADISEAVRGLYQAMDLGEMLNYVDVPTVSVQIDLIVRENGTWELGLNSQSAQAMLDAMRAPLLEGLNAYYSEALEEMAEQYEMTLEDFMAMYNAETAADVMKATYGTDINEMADGYFAAVKLNNLVEENHHTGTASMSGTTLTMLRDGGGTDTAAVDEAAGTMTLEVSENNLGLSTLVLNRQ